ncbi:MAG: methyltransferase domain-containing protein [Mycobacteriales bacterium]|nr:methyltransferase domain-containing protein [Mycobacteriales bacterium]
MTAGSQGIGIERAGEDAGLDRYYDSMFRDREAIFPQALELDFWRDHFVMQACRSSEVLHGRVVDLGCGTGEVDVLMVEELPAVASVTGLDISDHGLSYARRHRDQLPADARARVHFHKADITATGLPAGSADAVLLSHTLEHLWNPAPVLREIGRLLTADGLALVVVPEGRHHDDPDHKRHLGLDGYRGLLGRYGEVHRTWASEEGDQLAFVVRPRPRARMVAVLRFRDEQAHAQDLLDHLADVVDAAVVLDDRSGDATPEICAAHPLVTTVLHNRNEPADEVRDKNRLLDAALADGAEWVLALDADERIEPGGEQLLRAMVDSAPPWVDCLSLDCLHLWDSMLQARFDGAYGRDIRHPRLFRTEAVRELGARFASAGHDAGLHCGSVPAELVARAVPTPVRFLHLGYLDEHVRLRKSAFYAQHDPEFFRSGSYEHILTAAQLLLPVTDRRDLLRGTRWSWEDEAGPTRSDAPAAQDGLVLVDGALPEAQRRAVHQTRSGYRVQVGGAASVWADLWVTTLEEARDVLGPDVRSLGFGHDDRREEAGSVPDEEALRAALAAATAWRAEFERSRAGRLLGRWRSWRDRSTRWRRRTASR